MRKSAEFMTQGDVKIKCGKDNGAMDWYLILTVTSFVTSLRDFGKSNSLTNQFECLTPGC
jgi:hypothetical protein